MNIRELLQTTKDREILDAIRMHYGDEDSIQYKKLIDRLRRMKFEKSKENLTVFIKVYKEIENEEIFSAEGVDQPDSELIFDVSAYDGKDIVYSIASISFNDFLNLYVDSETMDRLPSSHILAHCLYEITSYSFEDKE